MPASGWPVSTAFPLRAEHLLGPYVARLAALDDVVAPIVVGCSGGADSLALLALVRAAGHETCAVYVDHGLRAGCARRTTSSRPRPRGSVPASDAVVASTIAPGGNLEARARDARYAALAQVARRGRRRDRRSSAHTRDDQAETVLLEPACGGARTTGLAGMPARARLHASAVARVPPGRDPRDLRAACGSRRCTTR